MRTKFWRIAYEDQQLPEILGSKDIYFPDFKRWPLAKNSDPQKIKSELREGDLLLLANFDRTSEIGTVKGVGLIRLMRPDVIEMEWRKPIPSWSLTPDIRGGVQQWVNEAAFCFDAEPVKRYKLAALTEKLFLK